MTLDWRRWLNTRDKADTLLLLGACAFVLVPHALHLPYWTSLICAVALGWRAALTLAGKRLPPRALLLTVALLSMAMVLLDFHTLLGRDAGVAMLVLLLTFKLLEMRARRDAHIVVLLAFFILLTQFFYSQSMATAATTAAAVILLLTAQLSLQYTARIPPLAQRVRFAARIVMLAAPLALVLFLVFPRIQGPLWGMPAAGGSARTGLSSDMTPGSVAELAQSDELAFRVRFDTQPPPQASLYWRAIVLSDFDGTRWSRRARPLAPAPLRLQANGAAVRYRITQEASDAPWLFALEMPRVLPEINGMATGVSPEFELFAGASIHERIAYDQISQTAYRFQPGESSAALQLNLALPTGGSPRARAWAAALRREGCDGRCDDDAVVQHVLRLFHDAPFRYTLRPPPLAGDTVDAFLFETRAGFCEHYAGAFTVLMRAAGIPARVVTGYQGGEINPVDGVLTVRQSDAHAWSEVWLGARGWVRVDPTASVAPERVEKSRATPAADAGLLATLVGFDGAAPHWLRMARYNLAALDNGWNQWILNYTPQRQRQLLRQVGINDGRTGMIIVALLALAALALLPLMGRRPGTARLDLLYRAFCDTLARQGLPRAPHEGPLAYRARVLAHGSGDAARDAARAAFLTLYAAQKYGLPNAQSRPELDTRPSASALRQLKILLTQCK